MRFRTKLCEIEATQWFKNGDHPEDYTAAYVSWNGGPAITSQERYEKNWEGDVVRYFRRPDVSDARPCKNCDKPMRAHGWIDTHEGGHIVCPGDWIVTGLKGEYYPVKPDIFALKYEAISA